LRARNSGGLIDADSTGKYEAARERAAAMSANFGFRVARKCAIHLRLTTTATVKTTERTANRNATRFPLLICGLIAFSARVKSGDRIATLRTIQKTGGIISSLWLRISQKPI
jgi:hypothetical protein